MLSMSTVQQVPAMVVREGNDWESSHYFEVNRILPA